MKTLWFALIASLVSVPVHAGKWELWDDFSSPDDFHIRWGPTGDSNYEIRKGKLFIDVYRRANFRLDRPSGFAIIAVKADVSLRGNNAKCRKYTVEIQDLAGELGVSQMYSKIVMKSGKIRIDSSKGVDYPNKPHRLFKAKTISKQKKWNTLSSQSIRTRTKFRINGKKLRRTHKVPLTDPVNSFYPHAEIEVTTDSVEWGCTVIIDNVYVKTTQSKW